MNRETITKLVDYVQAAQDGRYEIEKIVESLCPGLTVADAYLLQEELIRRRLAAGDEITGPKMGLTSRAKLEQMHVTDPIYGYVLKSTVTPDGGTIGLENFIHPKAEPEIGFILARDVRGPGVTEEDIMAAVDCLFPAMEIIDSRYRNFDFTLPDVIADNTSAAGAVFGTPVRPAPGLDLAAVCGVMTINGQEVGRGTGAAVMDHPARSVACLANMLAEKGEAVKAGQPILTGALTAAAVLHRGDRVEVAFDGGLGAVRLRVQ